MSVALAFLELGFLNFLTTSNDTVRTLAQVVLAITCITSLVLSFIMVRFKGKRPVDVAVVLREIAIALVIARIFISVVWQDPLNLWALIIYLYLGIAVSALLFLTIKEQWFPPPIVPERNAQLEACEVELAELKEQKNGHETT